MPTASALLSRQLGPLRRAVLHATRESAGLPDLSEAQIEVLRALAARSPQRPSMMAHDLNMARSTISNLIRSLAAAGLVDRTSARSHDQRGTEVTITDHARTLLDRYDRTSEACLAAALATLSSNERRAVRAALPALEKLTDVLRSNRLLSRQ